MRSSPLQVHLAAVFVALSVAGCLSAREPAGAPPQKKEPQDAKNKYDFESWVGKTKKPGDVEALRFALSDFSDLGKPALGGGPNTASAPYFRMWTRGKDGQSRPGLLIIACQCTTVRAAHQLVLKFLEGHPEHERAKTRPAAEIGDVCFVWSVPIPGGNQARDQGELLGSVVFPRNNVYVVIDQSLQFHDTDVKHSWDLLNIAARVDRQIIQWLPGEKKAK